MVSGPDVYVTGYESPGGLSDATLYKVGKFWKNGILQDLSNGTASSRVVQSAVYNSDFYVAATKADSVNGKTSAWFFKNTTKTFFIDGINGSGIVSRFILVPKS